MYWARVRLNMRFYDRTKKFRLWPNCRCNASIGHGEWPAQGVLRRNNRGLCGTEALVTPHSVVVTTPIVRIIIDFIIAAPAASAASVAVFAIHNVI